MHPTLTVTGTRFATAIWKSKQCLFQFPNLIDRNQRDCKFHACPEHMEGPAKLPTPLFKVVLGCIRIGRQEPREVDLTQDSA